MSVIYEFMVDWDSSLWSATPNFSEAIDNITRFVKMPYYLERGENTELGNCVSGTLDIILNNEDNRFSPFNTSSPLYGKIRPWLPIRLRATVTGGSPLVMYYGFISSIKINPHLDIAEAYLYATDGIDLLARSLVTADNEDRSLMTAGEAVAFLLDAAGWSQSLRDIDTDDGAIVQYPAISEY